MNNLTLERNLMINRSLQDKMEKVLQAEERAWTMA